MRMVRVALFFMLMGLSSPAARPGDAAPAERAPEAVAATPAPAMPAVSEAVAPADAWQRDASAIGDTSLAEKLIAGEGQPLSAVSPLVSMVLVMGILVGAILLLRRWQARLLDRSSGASAIAVTARHAIGPNAGLLVVRVRGEELLVGYGSGGMSLIKVLGPSEVDVARLGAAMDSCRKEHHSAAAPVPSSSASPESSSGI